MEITATASVRWAGTLRIDADGEAQLTLNDPRIQPVLLGRLTDYPAAFQRLMNASMLGTGRF